MVEDKRIDDYLQGKMTPAERNAFEQEMAENNALREQALFEEDVQQAFVTKKRDGLKEKFTAWDNEMDTNKSITPSEKKITKPDDGRLRSMRWLRVVASIAFLALAGYFGMNQLGGNKYKKLYVDNYSVYLNTEYSITRSDTDETIDFQAFSAYEAGDYETAILRFNELQDRENATAISFYKAQAYLQTDELAKAKALFENVVAKNEAYSQEAMWYLALIEIKEANTNKAKAILKTISETKSYKWEQATELLRKLK